MKAAVITIVGDSTACIENFKSIICYENNSLSLCTHKGIINIKGAGLIISYYDDEEILVSGHITNIEFPDGALYGGA